MQHNTRTDTHPVELTEDEVYELAALARREAREYTHEMHITRRGSKAYDDARADRKMYRDLADKLHTGERR